MGDATRKQVDVLLQRTRPDAVGDPYALKPGDLVLPGSFAMPPVPDPTKNYGLLYIGGETQKWVLREAVVFSCS